MRTFVLMICAAAAMVCQAAELTITLKNDAGQVVATATVTTSNEVLAAVNEWRLEQKTANPDGGEPVLSFPTMADVLKEVIRSFLRSVAAPRVQAIKTKRSEIEAKEQELKALLDSVAK